MEQPLVSIITPCYNVSGTLDRYLNSILNQTYKNIEVIAVDDGSTDNTADVLQSYISLFNKVNMKLRYVYQENSGLGAAINTGLKYVDGDYLCWSDPDDFYMTSSIEKRLNVFKNCPDYAVVSSDAYVFNADDLCNPLKREAESFVHRYEENQFEYLLLEQSHFCSGCHMIRMSDFDKVNPKRDIFTARRGQNWQMLLPVYYKFKRYFLDEPLYAYIVYPQSMSSGDCSEEKILQRYNEHEQIIVNTLNRMDMSNYERNRYMNMVAQRYVMKKFYLAIDYRDKALLKKQYDILKNKNEVNPDIKHMYVRNKYTICKIYYKIKDLFYI